MNAAHQDIERRVFALRDRRAANLGRHLGAVLAPDRRSGLLERRTTPAAVARAEPPRSHPERRRLGERRLRARPYAGDERRWGAVDRRALGLGTSVLPGLVDRIPPAVRPSFLPSDDVRLGAAERAALADPGLAPGEVIVRRGGQEKRGRLYVSVRVQIDLHARWQALARKERRSLQGTLATLVESAERHG